MANRVLRDWTTSEAIDEISADAERLFTRLIMKADDYGSFHSNPKLIRAACFPLKELKDSKISEWIDECIGVGLIFKYVVDGKEYIRIRNFGQRLRNMRGIFPQPIDSDPPRVAASCSNPPPETKRNEVETETETKAADAPPFEGELLAKWNEWEQHRKEKKNKLTPTARKQQIKFLGGRPPNDAISILDYSLKNGYTGLFELKENGNGHRTKTSTRPVVTSDGKGKTFGSWE